MKEQASLKMTPLRTASEMSPTMTWYQACNLTPCRSSVFSFAGACRPVINILLVPPWLSGTPPDSGVGCPFATFKPSISEKTRLMFELSKWKECCFYLSYRLMVADTNVISGVPQGSFLSVFVLPSCLIICEKVDQALVKKSGFWEGRSLRLCQRSKGTSNHKWPGFSQQLGHTVVKLLMLACLSMSPHLCHHVKSFWGDFNGHVGNGWGTWRGWRV